MKKKLAIFDFDDTLFRGQSHVMFNDYLQQQMLNPLEVYGKKLRKRIFLFRYKTDRELKESTLRFYKGTSKIKLTKFSNKFYEEVILKRINKVVSDKLIEHSKNSYEIIIISGAYNIYLNFLNDTFPIDHIICTQLKFDKNKFSGKIDGEECLGQNKVEKIKEVLRNDQIDWDNSFVYSDHNTDMPLFDMVGNKVVVDFCQKLDWVDKSFIKLSLHH